MQVPDDGHTPTPSAIEVELRPIDEPSFVARVRLLGEHDLATSTKLREALDAHDGNLLVDLSACEFIDSTVIGVLLASASTRAGEGHRLEIVATKDTHVLRVLEITGVSDLVGIRRSDRRDEG